MGWRLGAGLDPQCRDYASFADFADPDGKHMEFAGTPMARSLAEVASIKQLRLRISFLQKVRRIDGRRPAMRLMPDAMNREICQ